jgi:mRNA-degrading endonuclease RelE of RelBE toxin-antitoxin system
VAKRIGDFRILAEYEDDKLFVSFVPKRHALITQGNGGQSEA